MIHEPLDFKRVVRLLARRKLLMLAAAVLGACGGVAFAVLRPPLLTSEAWIVLPPSIRGGVGTQVVIAHSDAVLSGALPHVRPKMSLQDLRAHAAAANRTPTIIVISAKGGTSTQARDTANAVAQSYVDYVRNPANLPDGPVQARILQRADTAAGTKPSALLVGMGLLGAALGALITAFGILAVSRRERRLWERDAIADSIGVPVIASVNVDHPSDPAGWRNLLETYQPGAVDAWRMRKALQYLGLGELNSPRRRGSGITLTVLSYSFDRKALALGPQLAVFAASRGIPTALVIGPQPEIAATATLRAACAAPLPGSSTLRVVVNDHTEDFEEPDAALTVVVTVVRGSAPQLTDVIRTGATVLGVSAGAATAEQLARAAAGAAAAGHSVIGLLVADPDPADTTTGRLPQVERPAHRRGPTRMTGTTLETRE